MSSVLDRRLDSGLGFHENLRQVALVAMDISVIISTFRQPKLLEQVLWGYVAQRGVRFELVIAEDDQDTTTAQVIERMRGQLGPSITNLVHVRHRHTGFRKCVILNRAILAASGDYLIFTDGDCIPHQDLILTHASLARDKSFLSGGYFKLNSSVSERIGPDEIKKGICFDPRWLRRNGQPWSRWMIRLRLLGTRWAGLLDLLTSTRPTWNGCNASTFKRYVLDANGFDHRMQYGGLDREFGERLVNMGLRPIQIRHRAICLHLHHERSYASVEGIAANKALRKRTIRQGITRTPFGIEQLDKEPL